MKYQLFIKHPSDPVFFDLYERYGATMGDSFIETLDAPVPLKEMVTFGSRIKDGKQVRTAAPVADSRDLTLSFVVAAQTQPQYRRNKDGFLQWLTEDVNLELRIPQLMPDKTFRLVYTGKNVQYGELFSHTIGTITAKFIEPNPKNRSND